ncbi:MAG: hypothetical protein IKO34_02245, partial [Bacteroidales bacterium]|nr:hypothetical protein [Bacteroidales bacterium]
ALSNTYTVSATVGGCERTQTATVTTKPVITSEPSSSEGNEFCLGVSTDLSVESNASSFTWDNGAGSGSPVTVTPTATTTYKVSATSGSCVSTSSITITVNTPDITDYDYIWRGVSDDWNTAENWYMYSEGNYSVALALPSETKNYYIGTGDCLPTSQWPSLSADATIGNVTIDGGSVTVPDGVTLSIAGTISGALTAEEGSTIEFVGSSDQTINDSQTFSNVTFNKDGANVITATGGLTVNGTATFTSGIVTGNVTFGSGATVSGASTSSYVNGKVTRNGMSGAFTFPTGTATLYAPFKATSSSASNVSVQYAAGHDGMPDWWNHSGNLYDAGLNHASDRENWQLSASASTELSSIILYWNESDNHSFEEGNEALNSYLNVAAVKRNGFNWQNLGRASIEGDYDGSGSITAAEPLVIEISGAKAAGEGDYFVTFASSNNNLVLPIELTSFTATCDGRSALVEWTTATEKNNDYFSLERSDDAINFTEVARVAGAGNSIEPIDYAYNDYSIHGGDNYYRLVQVDYDGTRTVSEVIVANCIEPESDG